jgi:hypothetical protein
MGQHHEAYESRVFQDAIKNYGCKQPGENAAENAAKGHPQVELREVFGGWAQVVKALVEHQGHNKEKSEVKGDTQKDV